MNAQDRFPHDRTDDVLDRFLREHAEDDPARLLLSRDKWPGIDMDLAVNTLEGRRRIRTKLPSWYACEGLRYPTRLCTEQCSSEETARYKAAVAAERIFPERPFRIADLTGGLGVDCWAFAQVAEAVLYNETDPVLAAAVGHNFARLGVAATLRNRCTEPGAVADILGDFRPDVLYLDPARRAESGRKVFLLDDCRPDLLALQDELFGICPHLLIKLSPMADLTYLATRLQHVREIHVVAAGGECKELLLWMDRAYTGAGYRIVCYESGALLACDSDEEASAQGLYCSVDMLEGWLFEPGKSLTKAGLFKTICGRFGLRKLSPDAHLYITPAPDKSLGALGKLYRIVRVLPLSSSTLRQLRNEIPAGDVTARGLHLSSDELRKKLGLKSSPSVHIFGAPVDRRNYLIVTTTA